MSRLLSAAIRNNRLDIAAHALVVSLIKTKLNGHNHQEIVNAKTEEDARRAAGQSKRG